MKTINNTDLTIKNVGENVTLYGWVQKIRNLGGLLFIDLRDRSGIIQLAIKPDNDYYDLANSLKNEYVIKVNGIVVERENKNSNIETGDIEINVLSIEQINKSAELPFSISDDTTALEDTRLKYRYLDLRRKNIQSNLILRHNVNMIARNYLSSLGFIEIETPILCKSTPEGARDYLVPSRMFKGKFYALPQSPQIYKQLLMIGGMEKYFQIARCFRDEDLRADRQPEFTQIDIEMSFASEEDIWGVTEGLMGKIFKDLKNVTLDKFPRVPYVECIDKYGSDKPDTRFGCEINDITSIFGNTCFTIFKDTINNNGIINAIVINNKADSFSRKDIDKLGEFVKIYGAKALAYLKFDDNEFSGSIAKFLTESEKQELVDRLGLSNNDIVFVIADKKKIVKQALGALRLKLGNELNLIDKSKYNFLWVLIFQCLSIVKRNIDM